MLYMESHAKYGESIYFHDDGNVYVNLFIPSVLEWEEKGLALVQETAFPEDDSIALTFLSAPEEETDILLRYPGWSGIPVPSLGRTGAWIATAPAPPGTGGSSGRPPGSGQGGPDDCRRRRAGLSGYVR